MDTPKDKDGKLPKDFKMATLGVHGPSHNAWTMVSAALVLFITLRALLTGMLARNIAKAHLATNLKGYVTDFPFQRPLWE